MPPFELVRYFSAILCGDRRWILRRARAWKSREKLPISIPSAFEDGKHPGTELLLPAPMKESKSSAFSSILPVYLSSKPLLSLHLIITQLRPFSFWSSTFSLYNCSEQMDRIVAYWFAHSCYLLDCTNYCSGIHYINFRSVKERQSALTKDPSVSRK